MKGPLARLMQQAQKVQEDMKKAHEELARTEVTGESGGGLVKVTMTGQHEVRRVTIDRALLADDPDMAEDLVAAATNDAVNKVAQLMKDQFGGLAGGLKLPGGLKFPF